MHLNLFLANLDLVNLEVWENMLIFNLYYYSKALLLSYPY